MIEVDLEQTCGACPEQYDAFCPNSFKLGYLRLRHGVFTVECPDAGGELVYEAYPKGDGAFEPDEREKYLNAACEAIKKYYEDQQ